MTPGGIVDSWNPAAERLYGYTVQEANGREISFLFPPDRAGERATFFQQVREGRTLHLETVKVRKDGTHIDVALTLSPVRDADGSITGLSGISHDITAKKQSDRERARLLVQTERARADAEAANRAKDEFLAILSHELRAPLNSILMWSQLLRVGGLDEAMAARALESIERQTKAQAQLIADLLDVSRIIAGKLPLDLRRLELVPVVEAALEAVRPTAEAKEVRLEAALEPGIWVTGDAHRLQPRSSPSWRDGPPRGARSRVEGTALWRKGMRDVRVLICDDEPDAAHALRVMVERLGHTVAGIAYDGR
jgi:PAS domain S-box-containing protein